MTAPVAAGARKGRWTAGGLFLCLVLCAAGALFSDCFAWQMEKKGRPLAEFIHMVFAQEADKHREVMRREEQEAALRGGLSAPALSPPSAPDAAAAPEPSPAQPVAPPAPGPAPPVAPREAPKDARAGKATFGFYFPVYNEVTGTLNVVGMVRRHYPDSPIHLLQDGGSIDFGQICKLPKYNCSFEVVPGENSRWNPHSWFERMLSAAKRLSTTYVIYLEPDVIVRHRHAIEPKYDAGGMYDNYNAETKRDTIVYLERRGRELDPCFALKWRHFGLAGGSYFRTEALLDAFDPRNVARLDFAGMEKKEGSKAMSSDFAMLAALASRGWTVYPWEEASQKYGNAPTDKAAQREFRRNNPAWNPDAAFEHAHKEHYGHPIPPEEEALIGKLSGIQTVTCHGCVWHKGERLETKLKIPSSPPRPPNAEDRYEPSKLKRLPMPKRCREGRPATIAADSPSVASDAYEEVIYAEGRECGVQGHNFGTVETLAQCDKLVAGAEGCGDAFMFSPRHLDWACRCCTPGGQADGAPQKEWNVYMVQSPAQPHSAPAPAAAAAPAAAPKAAAPAPAGLAAEAEPEDVPLPDPVVEPAPAPLPADASGYRPVIYARGRECETQAKNFGNIETARECDKATAAHNACGGHFMFSFSHPSWQCRCCTRDGPDDGPESPNWDVLTVQSEIPEARRPPPPKPFDPGAGLPVAEGPRPAWLVKQDGLVIDARRPPGSGGGVLILQAVLMDKNSEWGKKRGRRPRWLRAILATNREHARLFGHAMALRWAPSEPQLTSWQRAACRQKKLGEKACVKENERENYNWEKHLMMAEYLNSPQNFSHVFMLDADAAIVRPDHDVLAGMAAIMEEKGKDVFLSDEDWLKYGNGRINGGLILVKNTPFTRGLFNDTFDAHRLGRPMKQWRIGVTNLQCASNEQICLNDLFNGGGKAIFAPHAMLTSGKKYNRGGCVLHSCGADTTDPRMKELGMSDPELEIMHFMGGSKHAAASALCKGPRDLTGGGPDGYGCRE